VHSNGNTPEPNKRPERNSREETKDLREANENIRRSQGDSAADPHDDSKSGNKPAFDRDR
jgi:hypothetical protein